MTGAQARNPLRADTETRGDAIDKTAPKPADY